MARGGGGGNPQRFIYTANGAETANFVLTLPAPRASTNYIARAFDGGRVDATLSFFVCPISGYLLGSIVVSCTQSPDAGDKIMVVIDDIT